MAKKKKIKPNNLLKLALFTTLLGASMIFLSWYTESKGLIVSAVSAFVLGLFLLYFALKPKLKKR